MLGAVAISCCALAAEWIRTERYSFRCTYDIPKSDLRALSEAIEEYAADHEGKYPRDLYALLDHGVGLPAYLPNYTTVPKDPWKRPYRYELKAGGRGWRVWTLGSDGWVGGEDDAGDRSLEK